MKEKLQMIYRCEHCNKLYLKRGWCVKHELLCKKNPDNNRPCLSCTHMYMKDYEFEDVDPQSSSTWTRPLYYCSKQNMYIYPPWITTPHDLDTDENEPMPKECDLKRRLHKTNTTLSEW